MQHDRLLDVSDMVTVLFSLYEAVSSGAGGGLGQKSGGPGQNQVNVPLCLDLALNWLLNIYDW